MSARTPATPDLARIADDLRDVALTLSRIHAQLALLAPGSGYAHGRSNDVARVIGQVCAFYDITETRLLGSSRRQSDTLPRWVALHLLRRLTRLSLSEVGDAMHRHHTSVKYATQEMKARLEREPKLRAEVREIEARLNGETP